MIYISEYESPLGKMTLAEENGFLIGLWFNDQKYFGSNLTDKVEHKETTTILESKHWLDIYFNGEEPKFTPKLAYGSSPFQKIVLDILLTIPYGHTKAYGEIAKEVAHKLNKGKMSAQAVGNAISHNPISIIIPCHRVLSGDGSLAGYAGGIDRKEKMLELENISFKKREY